jgi:hypothetical protein
MALRARGRVLGNTIIDTSILDVCDHDQLFKPWFRKPATWRAWRVFLSCLFGLPIADGDLETFRRCTGLETPPSEPFTEAWLVCGRRAGKSFILAVVAIFLAIFKDWSEYLSVGERGCIKILACDRRQARTIHRYCRALLTKVDAIAGLVERSSEEDIDLSNGITIEIQTASFRTVRGFTVIGFLCDEIAFWRSDESSNPDTEILAALRPAMSTVPGSMLLCASSPYRKAGALWDAYRKHYGKPGPVLVWQADTRVMNPTVASKVIDEAYERDPASAAAEYGAQFRSDVDTFLSRELVDIAIDPGILVRPPLSHIRYHAFADPSGGSGDSFTAAISHVDDNVAILDALYERRPPFNPSAVVAEIADLCRQYGVGSITGDRYSANFVVEAFAKEGIAYQHSQRDRSQLYSDSLPLFTTGRVRLLDHPRLAAQLTSLERRVSPAGRDRIDHGPGPHRHDDLANAVAGALINAARPHQPALIPAFGFGGESASRLHPHFQTDSDTFSTYSVGRPI